MIDWVVEHINPGHVFILVLAGGVVSLILKCRMWYLQERLFAMHNQKGKNGRYIWWAPVPSGSLKKDYESRIDELESCESETTLMKKREE